MFLDVRRYVAFWSQCPISADAPPEADRRKTTLCGPLTAVRDLSQAAGGRIDSGFRATVSFTGLQMWDGNVTDFGQIPEYGCYVATDEYRSGLLYPAVIRELGELCGKRILDIGTGNSPFPRLMAKEGAFVIGYDKSPKQIELAHQHAQGLNIEFVVATPQTFSDNREFDFATSIMVLPYAEDVAELQTFFQSVNQHLCARGKFVSVTLNPRFTKFETNFFIRRMTKLEGNLIKMEFLKRTGERGLHESLFKRQYTETEYEQAAATAGMSVAWKPLIATPQAVAQEGEDFWRPVHEAQPYILAVAQKI